MVDNSTKRGSSESVPIPAADFGIEKATEIPSLPDFSEKRKIDIKYPLIKPYAYAHIHWDEDQKEVVYELKEPPLNLKEKHVLKELEKGLEELINISFINIKDKEAVISYLEKNARVLLAELGLKPPKEVFLKFMYYI